MQVDSNARDLEEEAQKRMQQSLYPEVKRIACVYRNGALTLSGIVSSFYARRIAEELVKDLEGIDIVNNELVIVMPPESSPAAS
jgi:osmotically-inducible protein OsmY